MKLHAISFGLAAAFVLVACGGGGDASTAATPTPTATVVVSPTPSAAASSPVAAVPDTADTTAPSAPTAPGASQVTATSLTVSWGASTDNTGVVRYEVYRNGTLLVGSTTQTFLALTGLTASTTYSLTIKAFDAAGNASGNSITLVVSTAVAPVTPVTPVTPAPDTTPPSVPTGLAASNVASTSLTISWTASSDNVGVVAYYVYRDGTLAGSTSATSFTLTGLSASTSYAMTVKAVDAAGNMSAASASLVGSTTSGNGFAITAAALGANTVTVTGVGFGVKAQAAPLKFEDFDTRTTGAAPATFGYTNYGGFGGSTTVDNTQAYSGGKSLRHQGNFGAVSGNDVAESFPHIAVNGFSATELYLSYRMRFDSNGGRLTQLKFNRSGMEVAGAGGSPCYGGKPKFYSSYYPDGPSANRYSSDKTLRSVQGGVVRDDGTLDEGWVGESSPGSGTVLPLSEGTWVQVEEYYRLNDMGQANGEHVTWVNGNLHFNRHDIQMRTSAAQVLNCSYLVVGMDYWINPSSTNGPTVWYDDHYLDTSRARLVLANAATWAGSTIRSPQPATQWSATTVAAQLKTGGFAADADAWLYVVRADGSVSAGWKIHLN